jgi:putative ABC transport system permease protein
MVLAMSEPRQRGPRVETTLQDLHYAFRLLRKAPSFTVVVLLTVALGVAANTIVFAFVYAALIKPLPYPHSDRMVTTDQALAPAAILDWRQQSTSFDALAAHRDATFDVTGFDKPERVQGAIVTSSFFAVVGVAPAHGRAFGPADDERGERVAILSQAYWQARFGSDPRVVGRTIVLNGERFAIVGVMPAGFRFPESANVWVPPRHLMPEHPLRPMADAAQMRGSHYLNVFGRLKPGVTVPAAQAEQRAIFERLIKQYPADMDESDLDVTIVPLRRALVGDIEAALLILLATVATVLLIACANIANLMLARSAVRAQEITVRLALGASRGRVMRQLLTESVVLALAGGALGALIAAWSLPLLATLAPASVRDVHATLSVPVIVFSCLLSLVTGVIFGCVPALQSARAHVAESLRTMGRLTDGVRGKRIRQALIVAECAASVVLLIVAGLLIRSFVSLRHVDPGFDSGHLQTARLDLPAVRYTEPERQAQFFDQLLERLKASPGTAAVAAAARLPFVSGNSARGITLDHAFSGEGPSAGIRIVSAGYFEVMGQRVLHGREFTDRDRERAPLVGVINETMARRYWPGQDALGHRFKIGDTDEPWIEIVGIVADVKHASLREPPAAEFYQPYPQAPWTFMTLVVRTPLSKAAVAATLEQALAAVDPAMPVPIVQPMSDRITGSVAIDRFQMIGLAAFASVALALAAVGLYGVMSYVVSRRTREIGLRIALGASPREILRLVMTESLRLTITGLGIGLVMAGVAARALRGWLFGVAPADPLTFVSVVVVLGIVAALATYVPARRAMGVDPMASVRSE